MDFRGDCVSRHTKGFHFWAAISIPSVIHLIDVIIQSQMPPRFMTFCEALNQAISAFNDAEDSKECGIPTKSLPLWPSLVLL